MCANKILMRNLVQTVQKSSHTESTQASVAAYTTRSYQPHRLLICKCVKISIMNFMKTIRMIRARTRCCRLFNLQKWFVWPNYFFFAYNHTLNKSIKIQSTNIGFCCCCFLMMNSSFFYSGAIFSYHAHRTHTYI